MISSARGDLQDAGVSDAPTVVLADAGYWHRQQIDALVDHGIQVLTLPDAGKRRTPRRAGTADATRSCATSLPARRAARSTPNAKA